MHDHNSLYLLPSLSFIVFITEEGREVEADKRCQGTEDSSRLDNIHIAIDYYNWAQWRLVPLSWIDRKELGWSESKQSSTFFSSLLSSASSIERPTVFHWFRRSSEVDNQTFLLLINQTNRIMHRLIDWGIEKVSPFHLFLLFLCASCLCLFQLFFTQLLSSNFSFSLLSPLSISVKHLLISSLSYSDSWTVFNNKRKITFSCF